MPMSVWIAVSTLALVGCASAQPSVTLVRHRTTLVSGHYAGVDVGVPIHDGAEWSLDVDVEAHRLRLTGPNGSAVRSLALVTDQRRPTGCRVHDAIFDMDVYALEGPIQVAGTKLEHPILVAMCPSGRVELRERIQPPHTSGQTLTFDARPLESRPVIDECTRCARSVSRATTSGRVGYTREP
jgi:hypothetical protein